MNGRSLGGWLPAAAAAVLVLLAIDVVRQLELDTADTGFAFFVFASGVSVAAALAVGRWPERRRMGLLILAWLSAEMAVDFAVDWPTSRLAATLSALAIGLVPATYMLMVFSYPSGRVRDRLERLLVIGCFVLGLAWMTPPLLFADPRGCSSCAPRVPSLLFTGTTFDITPAGQVFWTIFIVGGAAFVALLLRRLRQAPPGARVTLLPLGFAVVFAVSEFIAQRIVWLGGWSEPLGPLDRVDQANTLILPVAIFLGIAIVRRRRGALGNLVVELGSARPGDVRSALARSLGDPTLELGLWLPERQKFIDEQGETLEVTAAAPGRAVTVIGPEREPLAGSSTTSGCSGRGRCSRRPARPRGSRSRTPVCRRSCAPSLPSCAPRGGGSSTPATPSAAGSSATCTTGPSNACSRSASPSSSSATTTATRNCSNRQKPSCRRRCTSSATSPAASTPPS